MSKIRQAVEYERQLVDAKVRAHVELTAAELQMEKALREQAIDYERKYTDGQFGQLNLVAQEHRVFHEREHLLYEDAIEKASASINAMLAALQTDVDRFREEAGKWMTVERFEREHANLVEKIGAEERVTLRSEAQQELLARIAQNNRWLIGILVTVALFGATTMLHILRII